MARRLAAAVLCAAAALACGGDETPRRPDVLLITVDTLRADRLGAWGYRLDTSPQMDALAERGVRFADTTVQWPKTWPSMASLLTGAHPKTTGLRLEHFVVPESLTVLPELFAAAGYRTGAVVSNFNLGRSFGFEQGFEFFEESWAERWQAEAPGRRFRNQPGLVKRYTDAGLVNDQALAWVRTVPRDERVFLWLHYMDPHGPYVPPESHRTLFLSEHPLDPVREALPRYQLQKSVSGEWIADLGFYRAQYDREVRYLDDEIGRLLEALAELGRAEDLLVVLTADHGESFHEHGYYLEHGKLPYQSSAHVPAIVVYDGVVPAGRTLEAPVGVIDLAPTLVELAGLEVPAQFEGKSLAPWMRGESDAETGAPERVFMESGYRAGAAQRSVREGRWKLVEVPSPADRWEMSGARFELYDLETDPHELANVASAHPEVTARLAAALARWLETGGGPAETPEAVDVEALDPASREMLRALGYLDTEHAGEDADAGDIPDADASDALGADARDAPVAEAGAPATGDAAAVAGDDADDLRGVVLVVLDTMRADRLSIDGHPRATTPALDALARRGVRFDQAVSPAPWTLPAMVGLFTGSHPTRAVFDEDGLARSGVEALREAGIRTAAFTEGGFVSSHFGFDRGFDDHEERAGKVRIVGEGVAAADADADGSVEATFRAARDWLDATAAREDERFFLLVHTYEPHTPYRRRVHARGLERGRLGPTFEQTESNRVHLGEWELAPTELAYLSALYDGGVYASDRHLGRLLGRLDALGLDDRVAVIVTSDHGEDLGGRSPRHAADHGHSLYDELIRVPLVVHDPLGRLGAPARAIAEQARLVDVMPTVMDLLGLPPLAEADGRSLLPLARGEETEERVAFARVTRKGPERIAVRHGGFKLVREVGAEGPDAVALYDLGADPEERHDRAAEAPERVAALDALLDAWRRELATEGALDFGVAEEDMPDALHEQLRALGYVE